MSTEKYSLGVSSPAVRSPTSVEKIIAANTTAFVVLILVGIHTGLAITANDRLIVPFVMSFVAAVGII